MGPFMPERGMVIKKSTSRKKHRPDPPPMLNEIIPSMQKVRRKKEGQLNGKKRGPEAETAASFVSTKNPKVDLEKRKVRQQAKSGAEGTENIVENEGGPQFHEKKEGTAQQYSGLNCAKAKTRVAQTRDSSQKKIPGGKTAVRQRES